MRRSECTCPVVEVTVLEDRASVTRRGTIQLDEGTHRLRIEGVAPVLADKTLNVVLDGAELISAHVHRQRRFEGSTPNESAAVRNDEIRQKLREIRGSRDALTRRITRQEAQLGLESSAVQRLAEEAAGDVGWGRDFIGGEPFDDAQGRLRACHETLGELQREQDVLAERLADWEAQLREARQSTHAAWARIEIDVQGKGGEASLEIRYVVPGAAWRPRHRATLQGDTMQVETFASIWQRTGEPWNDAKIFVSTERASLGVDPPTLLDDELFSQKKAPGTQVEMREQEVDSLEGNRRDDEMPGIDDGGQVRVLGGEVSSIASNGRAHRIELGSFSSSVNTTLLIYAERYQAAVRVAKAKNESARPLLAGPVELVGEHGPAGRSSVRFVSPGAPFELAFGAHPDVRVFRKTRVLKERSRLISSWERTPHEVDLRLSNIGDQGCQVEVLERVPVSELESVEVNVLDETTGGVRPDRDGFIRWKETLPPGGHHQLTLRYEIAKKKSVEL